MLIYCGHTRCINGQQLPRIPKLLRSFKRIYGHVLPDFKAKKPFIHVSIIEDRNGVYKTDWDVQSCESFTKELGKWSKINPGMELPI